MWILWLEMLVQKVYKTIGRCLFAESSRFTPHFQMWKRTVFRPRPVYEEQHDEQKADENEVVGAGVFSPRVCQFISKRHYENKDSTKLAVVTSFTDNNSVGLVQLNDFVFGTNPRLDILQRVVVWQRAKIRAGTACVKNRSEVRGGGRKPWPQKGLGKARQGSIRAPHWRGGGVVHGPKPKSYAYTLPKKVRRMGLRVALSCRYSQGDLFVVESMDCTLSKTELSNIFERNNWDSVVLVDSQLNPTLQHAIESFKKAEIHDTISINVYSILLHHKIVLSLSAIEQLEERLCRDNRLIFR